MEPGQEPLLFRIETLLGRLEQALKDIETVTSDSGGMPGVWRIHRQVGASLKMRLSEQIRELEGKQSSAKTGRVGPSVWSVVNPEANDQLLAESLLYLQAAYSRRNQAANNLCAIVDLLFAEVAKCLPALEWKTYTVFSGEDSFDKVSDVVRIRYPVTAVWDMPICVHEFGHYVSDKLLAKGADGTGRQSIKEDIHRTANLYSEQKRGPQGTNWAVWLEEVFADVFGATALGPAFGYSSVILRFDPSRPSAERDGKHPADARRVYTVLTTLEFLNAQPELSRNLTGSIDLIKRYWIDSCASAGENSAVLNATDEKFLFDLIDRFYHDLREAAPLLNFRSWEPLEMQEYLFGSRPAAPEETRITDLLNAAWLCRIQRPSSASTVNSNFVKFCSERM